VKSVLLVVGVGFAVSRLAAADFAVTNTNVSGSGSLHQAITDANNVAGADRILFNIPGAGVHTIDVSQNPLPTVSDSLIIDGYSQPGAKPNSLAVGDDALILIQIDGGAGSAIETGLLLNGAGSDYVVRGLCLTGFGLPNSSYSVAITASEVHSAVVTGNFIGVLPDGETPRGNSIGVGHVTQLGGTDPAFRNVISGNGVGFAGEAYATSGAAVYGAVVRGNYIGTNASGAKAIPNTAGIGLTGIFAGGSICNGTKSGNIDLSHTIIGGTATGAGNVVSGNTTGVLLGEFDFCAGAYVPIRIHGVQIKGNLIGVQPDGVTPLPNRSAIELVAAAETGIGGLEPGAGNVIAFNDFGVIVSTYSAGFDFALQDSSSQRNQILSNAIYGNRFGIDLGDNGPTPNDPGDSDDGPNKYQNYPVIQSAEIVNGSVTIKGTLNSSANAQFTLQYFAESLHLIRPVQTCLGTSTVTTDANGNAPFSATFALSDTNVSFNMTATSQDGNTSEFSQHPARLKNISTRAVVQGEDRVPIAGIIARSRSTPGQVVIRALGPSLHGVVAPLPDPTVEVYDSKGALVEHNDNWRDNGDAGWVEQAGLAPTNDLEAAVWSFVSNDSHTAIVRDAQGSTGTAVVEVYDSNARYNGMYTGPYNELLNISTRGFVGTGDNVMIAGTILEQGAASTRIVARAIGPSLANVGVADPLADPILELRDSQGALIASNDNWRDGQATELAAVGLAPTNDNESAIFMWLPSGAYTAVVRGKGSATGVAVVELYNLY
jgi:hypothetical protein